MTRRALRAAAVVAIVVAAAACSDGSSPTPPPVEGCPADLSAGVSSYPLDGRTVWTVLPSSTNVCLTENPDSHFVAVDPSVTPVGRLFVFLPGSGAEARNYRRIVMAAASAGYHAVGLTYLNDLPVAARCALASTSCYADVRLEVVTGFDASPLIDVPQRESIDGRLGRLLSAMDDLDPGAGWGDFLSGILPRWDRISVAGHSQGGGHSLFIAQRTDVYRATAYSSAGDLLPLDGRPAPWMADAWITPADRRFGFTSELDELVSYAGTVDAWSQAGLDAFGAPASVDGTAPPFGGSHMLTTRAAPRNPGAVVAPNHSVTVVDGITPVTPTGAPVFEPVWRLLSFPPD